MKKLTIIGAGSAMFTQGLVADAIGNHGGAGPSEIALVDIEPGILEAMRALCARMVEQRGADIRIIASPERRAVLPGSDYVVTTIGVGGRRAWEQDVFIPRKYGIFQPVGDSVLPGGISRALRMIPALVDIVRDCVELCPGARIMNYANPMTANCLAVQRATGRTVTGSLPRHLAHGAAARPVCGAGTARGDLACRGAEPPHVPVRFSRRGEDAWPLVRERLAACGTDGPPEEPLCWELFRVHGAFPAPGDRHVTEFFPERFPGGRYHGKILGVGAFPFEGTIELGDRIYEEVLRSAKSSGPLPEGLFTRASGEHEQLMDDHWLPGG